jgi:two-component system, LytTR family, response regulator
MTSVRTMIVDDEPLGRAGVRVLLEQDPDIEVVAECADVPEAANAIRTHAPDLLFLDVQMPGLNGFDLVRCMPAGSAPVVVFVTAFDSHALQAFDAEAIDYVVKPIDEDRFAAAVRRAKTHVRRLRLERATGGLAELLLPPGPTGVPVRFVVRTGSRSVIIPAGDVEWIEAADYYARLHVRDGSHLLRESLTSLAKRLTRAGFVRVHRSALVRVTEVIEIRPAARNRHELVLRSGARLPVSRRRLEALERALESF